MQRQPIDIVVALLQYLAIPLEVCGHERATRSASDEFQRGIDATHLPRGIRGLHAVLGGRHVADLPGAIHFVAQTPVFHLVRIGNSISAPQLAPPRSLLYVAILDESSRLFWRTRAQIQSHERRSAGHFAPGKKFIGAELIGFQCVPRFVEGAGAVLFGPNAIEPVVAGDEVSSRITNDRHTELADFVEHVLAKSVGIGKLRTRIVDAPVNSAPKVLQERAPKIPINGRNGAPGIDVDSNRRAGCRHRLPIAASRQ